MYTENTMGVRASAPLRRKRGSEAPSPAAEPPLELAIISDPGEDLDDELAMVYLWRGLFFF